MDLLKNFEAIENAQNLFETHTEPILAKNVLNVDMSKLDEQIEKYEEMIISMLGIKLIDDAAKLLKEMFQKNSELTFSSLLKILATFYQVGYRFVLVDDDIKKNKKRW